MTIYAIGDIHGHFDLLSAANERVEADRAREGTGAAELIYIGDLVDRGPDSAAVVDQVLQQKACDPRLTVLMGNHDYMCHAFLTGAAETDGPRGRFGWLDDRIGGRSTLASYGLPKRRSAKALLAEAAAAVPEAHRDFLGSLPYSHVAGQCLFVHAGIRPGIALADQDPLDLIWIREEFLWDSTDHGPLVIHGHTPAKAVEHWGNRVNIDSGAAYGGPLSAVAIEDREVWLLTDTGRVAVA